MSLLRVLPGRYDWVVFLGLFVEAFALQAVPVILLDVSNDLGFPLAEGGFAAGGLIQLFAGITGISGMLLGSFFANKYGKCRVYLVGLFLLFWGILALAFAASYVQFVCFMMFANTGGCIIIGLAPALAHDLHVRDSGKYITIANSFWSGGMLLTVVLAGYIVGQGWGWRYVLIIGAGLVLLPTLLLLLPVRSGENFPESTESATLEYAWRMKLVALKCRRFWRFLLMISLVMVSELIINMWTASYMQLNFGASAEAGGFAVGCFAGGMIISRFVSGSLIQQGKIRNFILGYALAAGIITASLPFITSADTFYLMLFIAGLAIAPLWPCIQSYSVDQLPELDKMVVIVLLTICGMITFSFFSWITGLVASIYGSLNPVFYLVPVGYFLCVFILLLHKTEKCDASDTEQPASVE